MGLSNDSAATSAASSQQRGATDMADHDRRLKQISNAISEPIITRRGFVMATLTAGFALAVQPVTAETLTTDQTGLTAGEIQIRTTDGHIPAYRARPGQG